MIRTSLLSLLALASLQAQADLPSDTSISIVKLGGRNLIAVQAPDRQTDRQTTALLQQRVWMHFDETPLAEACDAVARATGVNIVVSAELRADSPDITMHVDDMSAALVMKWIGELGRVHITPMHGGLLVSNTAPRQKNKLVLYDASSLVASVPDFPGPEMGVTTSDEGIELHDRLIDVEDDSEERLDELVDLIADHLKVVRR